MSYAKMEISNTDEIDLFSHSINKSYFVELPFLWEQNETKKDYLQRIFQKINKLIWTTPKTLEEALNIVNKTLSERKIIYKTYTDIFFESDEQERERLIKEKYEWLSPYFRYIEKIRPLEEILIQLNSYQDNNLPTNKENKWEKITNRSNSSIQISEKISNTIKEFTGETPHDLDEANQLISELLKKNNIIYNQYTTAFFNLDKQERERLIKEKYEWLSPYFRYKAHIKKLEELQDMLKNNSNKSGSEYKEEYKEEYEDIYENLKFNKNSITTSLTPEELKIYAQYIENENEKQTILDNIYYIENFSLKNGKIYYIKARNLNDSNSWFLYNFPWLRRFYSTTSYLKWKNFPKYTKIWIDKNSLVNDRNILYKKKFISFSQLPFLSWYYSYKNGQLIEYPPKVSNFYRYEDQINKIFTPNFTDKIRDPLGQDWIYSNALKINKNISVQPNPIGTPSIIYKWQKINLQISNNKIKNIRINNILVYHLSDKSVNLKYRKKTLTILKKVKPAYLKIIAEEDKKRKTTK